MNTEQPVKLPHLEVLHQLFSTATRDASTAMCRWTNGLITLSLDEVREISLEQASEEFGLGGDLLTMVVMSLEGELGGEMILTFDEENGRQLAASLLSSPVETAEEWTELEKSALMETGNILSCAYMNALNRIVENELRPSPPYFVQDYAASVLQQAMMAQAMTSDKIMICQTSFQREGEELNWNVFFLPTAELQKAMEDALCYGS